MIVSWKWLADYVPLAMSPGELTDRLMMAGLNFEGSEPIGDDLAIDLEVTSNRPDCLGHLGVAREIGVLWDLPFTPPSPAPPEGKTPADDLVDVQIDCPDLCSRYSARIIRGARIGPSPAWLAERLETLGVARINNVVDVTNYVLLETGQPLHAFDLARLSGARIIVRRAAPGEKFLAINHKEYQLEGSMCVIADANRPVAIGGVMGGAETEVAGRTTDILLECAAFDPRSIRDTARALALHSPSSFRFERGVDMTAVDWVSLRAADLILQTAGGELCRGAVDRGDWKDVRPPVTLRLSQLPRVLGIAIDAATVRRILAALGLEEVHADAERIEVIPPTWRRDLAREIDLIEEAARIYGYDKIPEDVRVPMAVSSRRREDVVLGQVRDVLIAAGLDEAMTVSAVEEDWSEAFSPWTDRSPLVCATPVLRRADRLRRSLVPSLLGARRTNESLSNPVIELFEIAHVYLTGAAELPTEDRLLALTSGRDFFEVKGIVEAVVRRIAPSARLSVAKTRHALLDPGRCCQLRLNDEEFGYLGAVSERGMAQFELRQPATVAELRLALLIESAELIRNLAPISAFPPVRRDLNYVFAEGVRWADVEAATIAAGGPNLQAVEYQETYRDPKRLGAGLKSLLFGVTLRSESGTLTGLEADEICARIDQQLSEKFAGRLRA